MLFLWLVSGLGVVVLKRFSSKIVGRSRGAGLVTWIHLIIVALGIVAALRLPAAGDIVARQRLPGGGLPVRVGAGAAMVRPASSPWFWPRRMLRDQPKIA